MTDWGGSPRNINLNLPTDYLFKPTAKFVDWLERNTASLRMLTEDQIIQRARAALRMGQIPWFRGDGQRRDRSGTRRRPRGGGPLEEALRIHPDRREVGRRDR